MDGQLAAATCGPLDDDRQTSQKRSISAGEVYSTISEEWAGDHFWSWFDVNRSTFNGEWADIVFHIFVPSDLDLWPLKLKFAPLVTLVVSYVSTKLEVSIAFLFRENSRRGTDTEGVQRLMWPPGYGRIISGCISENVQDRHIAITRKLYVLHRTTWSPVTLNYLAECYQQHDKLFDGIKHLELKVMHWIALDLKNN